MIPKGWERKNLGEVITLQRGFDLPEQDRIHGTIPIISSSGITGFHNESKVSPPGIVTGRYGTIGKVFLVDVNFWPLNTSLWVKDFYGNDHRYVYYLLQSIDYKKLSDKTGVPGINRNDVHKLGVLLPPLLEQCRIAEVLGVWDESIDLLERLIGRVRSRKQGLMQQLLTGKKRFKAFEGSEYSIVKLSEVAKIRRGASPRPIQDPKWFAEKGRGWVRIRDVTASDTYLLKTSQYLSNLAVEKSVKVDPGDLIMSICATIGVPRIVGIPACIHDGFVVFREFEQQIDKFFLYHYINLISAKISDSGQPGTQKNINTTIVGNIEVPKFSIPEQEKIAAVLSAADEEISTLEKQLAAYNQQKLGLMQQLLTGKIRVGII
jgi:type I restriction enzyme, S subunit